MTLTSINSTTFESANAKAVGAVNYNETTFKKAGTISVAYGAYTMTFSTVTDYLIFFNEVIVPLTNKIHSVSGAGTSYVVISPGTPSTVDAVTD